MPESLLKGYSLTACTPLGTVSRLNLLCDPKRFDRVLLIKGGSKTARAKIITFAAEQAQKRGFAATVIKNSDSAAAEAVFWGRTAVIDAAAPNPIEPKYPTAFEDVVWLGECYNGAKLRRELGRIAALTAESEERQEQARRFLSAADSLMSDNRRMAREAVNEQKILAQARRTAQKLSGGGFKETACILSSCLFPTELTEQLKKPKTVVVLQDEQGCCAPVFLREVYSCAKKSGCEVIVGYSPFSPYERLEQLILPKQSLAFFTENSRLAIGFEPDRVIHSRRFTDKNKLAACKNRMAFNKKAAKQLLQSAERLFKEGQELSLRCDAVFDSAIDEQAFELVCGRVVEEVF